MRTRTQVPEKLLHKSVYVLDEVWRKARMNAVASRCSVRDYITYVLNNSCPVDLSDPNQAATLRHLSEINEAARPPRRKIHTV